MDDLVELALDVGGEVLELLVELLSGSGKKGKQRKKNASGAEAWERTEEKPPWEE